MKMKSCFWDMEYIRSKVTLTLHYYPHFRVKRPLDRFSEINSGEEYIIRKEGKVLLIRFAGENTGNILYQHTGVNSGVDFFFLQLLAKKYFLRISGPGIFLGGNILLLEVFPLTGCAETYKTYV